MNILITSIKVIDPNSSLNGKVTDIWIENGKIRSLKLKQKVPPKTEIIDGNGLCISPGWFDLRARFCDPGFEFKEDMKSGINAAMEGGFTGVALMPETSPVVHSKSVVEYLLNNSAGSLLDVYPVGAITRNTEGRELAEMYDMKKAGAVAFSDDKHSIRDAGVMLRALQYTKDFGGLIMHHSDDSTLSPKGQMHEGIESTRLGMQGIPELSETIGVTRDLLLAAEASAPIHFSTLSTIDSVGLIRNAKKKNQAVTCDIAAHQLAFTDADLSTFDSNFKVSPPFRTEKHIQGLLKGLSDKTIDVICSDHSPQDAESKIKEFDYALAGIIALETCFGVARKHTKNTLSIDELIEKIAINPRRVLGLKAPIIQEGEEANLSIFDADVEWVVTEKHLRSKSKNTPFIGAKLIGKPVAVINHNAIRKCSR